MQKQMVVWITQKQARRLLRECEVTKLAEYMQHAKKVNPVQLRGGTYLTYLRSDQSPDEREGYHLGIH